MQYDSSETQVQHFQWTESLLLLLLLLLLQGLIGAIAVTPTTFLLPPLLWVVMKQPRRWGLDWIVNWALVWITGLLGVLGAIGSVYIIVRSWSSFSLFAN